MREQRLVFGEDAELYDRARPSYPAQLVDEVVALVTAGAEQRSALRRGKASGSVGLEVRAVDAGCGTGKASVLLAERGVGGVGVDADPAMAKVARRRLARFPSWRVEVSDFEKWEPTGRAPGHFDLVCSAEAWHWPDSRVSYGRSSRYPLGRVAADDEHHLTSRMARRVAGSVSPAPPPCSQKSGRRFMGCHLHRKL